MTVAEKKRGRPKKDKQKEITDESGKPIAGSDPIKELEDLGEELDGVRSQRLSFGAQEKDIQERLYKAMTKYKVDTYRMRDGRLLLKEHKEDDKVKIKKPDDAEKKKKQGGRSGEADFGGE